LARIAGVDLPKNKHLDRALTYIYGIGIASAREILDKADLPYRMNSDDLNTEEVTKIRKIIEGGYSVEGDRRREVSMDIKRLTDLGCYRGRRHRAKLPCRGQRTKTNARTRKGPRKGAVVRSKE
jgi:small subunit ribosomal protein S13